MENNFFMDNIEQFSKDEIIEGLNNEDTLMDNVPLDADEVAWEEAKAKNSIDSFSKYLTQQQFGKHRAEARSRLSYLRQMDAIVSKPATESTTVNKKQSASTVNEKSNTTTNEQPNNAENEHVLSIVENGLRILAGNNRNSTRNFIEYFSEILDDDIKLQLLREARARGMFDVDRLAKLLLEIRKDNNVLHARNISLMIDAEIFTYDELEQEAVGIDPDFLDILENDKKEGFPEIVFESPQGDVDVSRNSTEIYFWGITATGKTCALGSILSVIKYGKVIESFTPRPCQAPLYMDNLPQCFNVGGSVTKLPASTSGTYEMSFDIVDNKNRLRKITLIDFAGEILRMIYEYSVKGTESPDLDALKTLLTADNLGVRRNNRKLHFIVVEYGAQDKMYMGIKQRDMLERTLNYIEDTGTFKNNTNGIFLVVTKADKLRAENYDDCRRKVEAYMENEYHAFLGNLRRICKENGIGYGFEILPFTLGKVCFQNYCKLDTQYAEEIAKRIVDRSYPEKRWWERVLGL